VNPDQQPSENPPDEHGTPCDTQIDERAIAEHKRRGRFFWLDLHEPGEEQLRRLGEIFGFHSLALEDAGNLGQRPKLDDYDEYAFLVFYGIRQSTETKIELSEVHMFVSGEYLITLHQQPVAGLDELRAKLRSREVRSEQFLVYSVLDVITDTFFPVLAAVDDEIDEIEDAVLAAPGEAQLQRLFALKRDLVAVRRVVTPQRDMLARSMDHISELPGLQHDARDYMRDLYDHLIRISDLVDSYRDLLSGVTDMYLSTVANRQGEVAKQLTTIATIFLPLTFITGFFGQNFSFLVNHVMNTTLSFIVLGLGSLVASCVVFLLYFRRRGWL
jgi:magnesium transporter